MWSPWHLWAGTIPTSTQMCPAHYRQVDENWNKWSGERLFCWIFHTSSSHCQVFDSDVVLAGSTKEIQCPVREVSWRRGFSVEPDGQEIYKRGIFFAGSVSPWFSALTCTQNTHRHPRDRVPMGPHKGAEDDSLMREFHRNTQTNTGRHNVGWPGDTFQWGKVGSYFYVTLFAEIYSLFWKSMEGNSGYKWGQWDSTWFQDPY